MNAATTSSAFVPLLIATSLAFADVNVQVGNGDKVAGTLSPGTEVETIRVRCPAGAVLTAKAKVSKRGPVLHVRILDGASASLGDGTGKSVSLKTVPLAASGEFRVEVTSQDGVSTGDYALSISWRSPTSFALSPMLAPDAGSTLTVAADAGAVATISLRPVRGSKATAALVSLTAPDSSVAPLTGAAAKLTLAATGDYRLAFKNTGAVAGGVAATVKLKLPKPSRRKVLLTSSLIGPGGAKVAFAFADVLGPEGGSVTVPVIPPGQPGAEISGASVGVPPGSLGTNTAIVIATAPDIDAPVTLVGAGPTVYFGPPGTQFDKKDKSKKATVSIPYSASFDAETDLVQIFTRDAKGKVTPVPQPYDFNKVTHVVSFTTSHFSSFRAVGPDPGSAAVGIESLADIADPRDVCPAFEANPPQVTAQYFIAEGTANTLGVLRLDLPNVALLHETWAGGGWFTTDGTPRRQFQFQDPVIGVAALTDGEVWIATRTQIFYVGTDENVIRYAGTGVSSDTGDTGPATSATFATISAIAVDLDGTVYVADAGAHRIRVIDPASHTILGWAGSGSSGISADGGPLESTKFVGPNDIALALAPNRGLYVADGARVRQLAPIIVGVSPLVNITVAGSPTGATGSGGDGGPLLQATFQQLSGVATLFDAVDPSATKLVVTDIADHTVRLLNLTSDKVTLMAGQHGMPGYSGDLSPLPGLVNGPRGLMALPSGITFADSVNGKIRTRFASATGFE